MPQVANAWRDGNKVGEVASEALKITAKIALNKRIRKPLHPNLDGRTLAESGAMRQ